jgi:hypothetical protein
MASGVPVAAPPLAHAQPPTSGTGFMHVDHYAKSGQYYIVAVEPNTGESWDITGTWQSTGQQDVVQTASADVDWNGSGWTVSNKSTTTLIVDIDVFDGDTCGSILDEHGYSYDLIARLLDPVMIGHNIYYLATVAFATTSVDDGYELIDDPCYEGSSVSPDNEPYSNVDYGPFEATYSCNAVGPSLSLTYQ